MAAVLLAVGWSGVQAGGGAAPGKNQNAVIFPPQSHPYGKSYGEWAAAFWQYAFPLPVEGHPFLDPEADVAAGQSGKVWFWSAPDGPLTRHVTMPRGTALFLTIRDAECSSLEEAPFFGATEEEQRACAQWLADHIVDVSAEIDGVPVQNIEDYRFQTPQFEFDAPTPWVFGATGGAGTAVGDGYFLMLKPMSLGTHTIHYSGTFHFDAGELGDEAFDLPHEGTIVIDVVK
jgi:hypothetical protein